MPTEASRNKKRGEPDTNLFIYRLGLARVDKKLVRVLAGKFNLLKKGLTSTFIETEEVFKFQSGGELLVINKSTGAFRLINKSLWQVDDGKSDLREITDAKAVKIASAYVKKYKLAPSKEYQFLKVARVVVGVKNIQSKEFEERVISLDVAFQRIIDKTKVDGPGGKIIVTIGSDLKPNSCEVLWRNIQRKDRAVNRIKSQETALEETYTYFKRRKDEMSVREIRFGYFEEGWSKAQKYLQPAYVVFATLRSPDGRFDKKTVFVTPAALNSPEQIAPRPQKTRAQPSRGKS